MAKDKGACSNENNWEKTNPKFYLYKKSEAIDWIKNEINKEKE